MFNLKEHTISIIIKNLPRRHKLTSCVRKVVIMHEEETIFTTLICLAKEKYLKCDVVCIAITIKNSS